MLTVCAMAETRLVIRERTALAVDYLRKVGALAADLTFLTVPHAELVVAWQRLECLAGANGFRGLNRHADALVRVGAVDVVNFYLLHSALVARGTARLSVADSLALSLIIAVAGVIDKVCLLLATCGSAALALCCSWKV